MTKRSEEALEKQLRKMKSMGITINYKPSPDPLDGLGRRAMETLHAKAKELGMTYGDEEATETEVGRD